MVLEPMSNPSEVIREGVESSKFRAGLDAEPSLNEQKPETEELKKIPGLKKAKGPNPLSMKKAKKRTDTPASTQKKPQAFEEGQDNGDGEESGVAKSKRRRRHNKSGPRDGGEDAEAGPTTDAIEAMETDE